MASSFTFKLNIAGFRELRKSAEVVDFTRREAEALAKRCGEGYEVAEAPSKNRARFVVFPATPRAMGDNAKNNTIIKALGKHD